MRGTQDILPLTLGNTFELLGGFKPDEKLPVFFSSLSYCGSAYTKFATLTCQGRITSLFTLFPFERGLNRSMMIVRATAIA
jgi:hypothetical protein